MKSTLIAVTAVLLAGGSALAAAPTPAEVVKTYVAIGAATYGDAYTTGKALGAAVDALIANRRPRPWRPPAPPGRPRASPTSAPRCSASATRSSTTGKAR